MKKITKNTLNRQVIYWKAMAKKYKKLYERANYVIDFLIYGLEPSTSHTYPTINNPLGYKEK